MTYISCFSDFAFYFYYYFMENCHTWIIISMWQNDLHTNTSRSVWPILYGLMIKMLQYKMYPAGELAVLRQLLLKDVYLQSGWMNVVEVWTGVRYWFKDLFRARPSLPQHAQHPFPSSSHSGAQTSNFLYDGQAALCQVFLSCTRYYYKCSSVVNKFFKRVMLLTIGPRLLILFIYFL